MTLLYYALFGLYCFEFVEPFFTPKLNSNSHSCVRQAVS